MIIFDDHLMKRPLLERFFVEKSKSGHERHDSVCMIQSAFTFWMSNGFDIQTVHSISEYIGAFDVLLAFGRLNFKVEAFHRDNYKNLMKSRKTTSETVMRH